MNMKISPLALLRKEYLVGTLHRKDLKRIPAEQFRKWLGDAIDAKLPEPNAMTLATCSLDGRPTARVVLMKHFDRHGLCFFTNQKSLKGRQLEKNPRAAAVFYWEALHK